MLGVIQGIGQSILYVIFIGVYSVGFNPSFGAGFKEYCTFLGKDWLGQSEFDRFSPPNLASIGNIFRP